MLSAVASETPGLESVASAMDPTRLGMAGHSAGGGAIANYGDTAQVLVPMAMRGVSAGSELRSTLVMGATADAIVAYSNARTGYDDSPAPKRFVGIEGAGHLVFSEVCELRNDMGNNILEVANEYQVCGAQFAGLLFQCDKGLTPNQQGWEIINYATSAAFEETLHCSSAGENFGTITTKFPLVAEFLEE